jgi:molecular chaperone DnaK
MVRDAEEHGTEDRERRSKAEARNRLDSLVYTSERSLGEHKDKLSPEDQGKLEEALTEAKRALEGGDAAAMDAAAKKLTEASHRLAEHMYQQGPQGPDAGPAGEGGPSAGAQPGAANDEVIDAEYVDVDESKR